MSQISSEGSSEERCRVCRNKTLKLGIDLGELPLANALISNERAKDPRPEPKFPLQVFYCTTCGLIQLLDIIDRKSMFDEYTFLTATAQTSMEHFDQYADGLASRLHISERDLVVDIGSNDGTLLKAFRRHGASVLGVEPARNVAEIAISDGIDTIVEYFGPQTVRQIGPEKAKLITANNVVSHVGDLEGFIQSVSRLLAQNGLFAFEVPWVVDWIRNRNFDIIYHEHLSYFGFKPLSRLMADNGLELIGVEYFPKIHGGTLRGIASHFGSFPKDSGRLGSVFDEEQEHANFPALEDFAQNVKKIRDELLAILRNLKQRGKRIVGYGAPAKATILLNYCSIDSSILDFVIDTTPLKQEKCIPGVRLPIVAPEQFRKLNPDYALLLAWNYKDEILKKEADYLKGGGAFIVPFPEPHVVSNSSQDSPREPS